MLPNYPPAVFFCMNCTTVLDLKYSMNGRKAGSIPASISGVPSLVVVVRLKDTDDTRDLCLAGSMLSDLPKFDGTLPSG
jgi:hypothetical protein